MYYYSKIINCNATLTAESAKHRLIFFCKALFNNDIDDFTIKLFIKNVLVKLNKILNYY